MPARDLALLEEAVRDGGKIARKFFEAGTFKRWDKSKGNPVTEADIAVDTFLRERLMAARPEFGWLSEETEDDPARLRASCVFVVDPIDGTIAFMKGRPHFTICAGIVRDGEAVAGAVFNPMTEECFTATKGEGAMLNGTRIHVSDRAQIEGMRMLGDKPMFGHAAWNNPPNRPWPPMEVETRNSIAYRMALVAGGGFDGMMALSAKRDWDMAAADVIVTEAGGIVTTHTGAKPVYNRESTLQPSLVAAGPKLHAELMARVSHINLPRGQER
ncbi:MAG: 3'(2'),5'-bisphosphate nucleotidase CysQ [Alphaproteobacteria bacterium]|nr:3'(2'),5'-bisphosphate nucleotidase CysQ [Alphaproteobacteria bacterium]MBV9418544.1 3'(2'),5'-bisphosphate nucleotidase CysQ [Alphaproteobacteria bacterium]MBV9539649.1 3'(2'),5'-bisphosphate nucleotidase CysQ [Alphaproteobacteria bacterium]